MEIPGVHIFSGRARVHHTTECTHGWAELHTGMRALTHTGTHLLTHTHTPSRPATPARACLRRRSTRTMERRSPPAISSLGHVSGLSHAMMEEALHGGRARVQGPQRAPGERPADGRFVHSTSWAEEQVLGAEAADALLSGHDQSNRRVSDKRFRISDAIGQGSYYRFTHGRVLDSAIVDSGLPLTNLCSTL